MKIKSVRFAMLCSTAQNENDRAECEVELGPKDTPEQAYALAIQTCQEGLMQSQQIDLGRRFGELTKILIDPEGSAAFKQFVATWSRRVR